MAKRGPNTPEGKARSSRNARKHGILSPHPAIIEELETVEEWEEFRDGIVASLLGDGASGGLGDARPEGLGDVLPAKSNKSPTTIESELADRLASILWRLRRVTRYETAIVNYNVHTTAGWAAVANMYGLKDKDAAEEPDPQYVALLQENRVIPQHDALDTVTRYEAHLHRILLQTLHELEALQARRRGEKTNLARIDVVAPPRGAPPPRGASAPQPRNTVPAFLERPLSILKDHGA